MSKVETGKIDIAHLAGVIVMAYFDMTAEHCRKVMHCNTPAEVFRSIEGESSGGFERAAEAAAVYILTALGMERTDTPGGRKAGHA